MNPEYLAPAGTVWVCAACGKHGAQRDWIGDESCFLHAVLCYADKLIVINGRVRFATGVPEEK